jgi:hypothetical protein
MLKTNQLEGRELATVLAALRYWQQDFDELDLIDGAGHFEDHKPLDADEIDELCEALNFPGETPAYTLFRHVTAGGAEYLTDNHMFADATLIIRLDGGAELVSCEGMKTETPEVQDRAALADRLEDAIKNPYVWMSANFSEDSFTSKETEKVIQAMREAAAILRGEKPEASGSIGDLVCSTCGGTNIHGLDWVNYNTNEFIGGNESLRDGDRWCEDCQDHPDYFVSPETFKEMQEAKNETP